MGCTNVFGRTEILGNFTRGLPCVVPLEAFMKILEIPGFCYYYFYDIACNFLTCHFCIYQYINWINLILLYPTATRYGFYAIKLDGECRAPDVLYRTSKNDSRIKIILYNIYTPRVKPYMVFEKTHLKIHRVCSRNVRYLSETVEWLHSFGIILYPNNSSVGKKMKKKNH